MKQSIKETYKQRIAAAVSLSNYLNDPDYTFDVNNLRYNEDQLAEAMALFMNAICVYINEMYASPKFNKQDAGNLKKYIINTINCVAGATMSFGKGLTLNKYSHVLKKIIEDIDPDEVIE